MYGIQGLCNQRRPAIGLIRSFFARLNRIDGEFRMNSSDLLLWMVLNCSLGQFEMICSTVS